MVDTHKVGRLADYFFVSGLPERCLLEDPDTEGSEGENGHALFRNFKPEILWRYPPENYEEFEFSPMMPKFCFPAHIQLKQSTPKLGPPQSTFHSFTTTDEHGTKTYGVVVIVNEPIDQNLQQELKLKWKFGMPEPEMRSFIDNLSTKVTDLEKQRTIAEELLKSLSPDDPQTNPTLKKIKDCTETIGLHMQILKEYQQEMERDKSVTMFLPKAIGIISHWPFYDFFKDYLCQLILSSTRKLELPIERYVVNLISEVPLPPPGKIEVAVKLDRVTLYCSRPPLNHIPVLKNFSFYPIFRAMSLDNILLLLEAVLSERKIVFYSKFLALLNLAAEVITTLVYPFTWSFPWMPCLPADLIGFLQAPMPFIIGLHSGLRQLQEPPSDAVIADLDANTVTFEEPIRSLPAVDRAKLKANLQLHADLTLPRGVEMPSIFNPLRGTEKVLGLVSDKSCLPNVPVLVSSTSAPSFPKVSTPSPPPTPNKNDPIQTATSPTKDAKALPKKSANSSRESFVVVNLQDMAAFDADNSTGSGPVREHRFGTMDSTLLSSNTNMFISKNDNSSYSTNLKRSSTIDTVPTSKSSHTNQDKSLPAPVPASPISPSNEDQKKSLFRFPAASKNNRPQSAQVKKKEHHEDNSDQGDVSFLLNSSDATLKRSLPSAESKNVVVKPNGSTPIFYTSQRNSTSNLFKHKEAPAASEQGTGQMSTNTGAYLPLSGPPVPASEASGVWNERLIQDSVFRMLVSLLKDYRKFLHQPDDNWQGTDLFRREEFLATFDTQRRAYMSEFLSTQGMAQFALERVVRSEKDYEVLFFDECIIAKRNRSRMRFITKENTPFLSDTTNYCISRRYQALEPNNADITSDGFTYTKFPSTWNAANASTPRPIVPLVSNVEQVQLKFHTSAITRAARLQKQRKKQEFNNVWAAAQKRIVVVPRLLTDEERSYEFDYLLDDVYKEVKEWVIADDKLPLMSDAYIQIVITALKNLQDRIIRAADDDQLVMSKDHERDLASTLQEIITQITVYQDHVTRRAMVSNPSS